MKTTDLCKHSSLPTKKNMILKNRIVVPPMASGTADADGAVTQQTLAHYKILGQSGAGLLIVEYTYVHSSGKSEPAQLGIDQDRQVVGLKDLATVIKASGAIAGIQLTHSGGKSDFKITEGQLMGPSGIRVPVKGADLEVPKEMSFQDIALWKSSFLHAADRAVRAGFQLIELHAAHGYGLNQFLSPITNQRTDLYGQTLEGRMRLILEIIELISKRHPQILISVRMPGQDFFENGLSIESSILMAQIFEKSGVDFIHVSSGIGGWRRPGHREGQGYLVEEASQIQKQVSVPVIGVGGITTGDYIDQSLKENKFSMAAVGRAILSGPLEWSRDQMQKSDCHLADFTVPNIGFSSGT